MISSALRMKDLGTIKKFALGINFEVSRSGNITMSRKEYAERLMKRFGMDDSKPRSYSMSERDVDETETLSDARPYQELVGC